MLSKGRPLTADQSRTPDHPPAWFVATDQGVVLAGPFPTYTAALVAHGRVVERLRASLNREQAAPAYIASRLRAVAPQWGVLVGAHQQFERR